MSNEQLTEEEQQLTNQDSGSNINEMHTNVAISTHNVGRLTSATTANSITLTNVQKDGLLCQKTEHYRSLLAKKHLNPKMNMNLLGGRSWKAYRVVLRGGKLHFFKPYSRDDQVDFKALFGTALQSQHQQQSSNSISGSTSFGVEYGSQALSSVADGSVATSEDEAVFHSFDSVKEMRSGSNNVLASLPSESLDLVQQTAVQDITPNVQLHTEPGSLKGMDLVPGMFDASTKLILFSEAASPESPASTAKLSSLRRKSGLISQYRYGDGFVEISDLSKVSAVSLSNTVLSKQSEFILLIFNEMLMLLTKKLVRITKSCDMNNLGSKMDVSASSSSRSISIGNRGMFGSVHGSNMLYKQGSDSNLLKRKMRSSPHLSPLVTASEQRLSDVHGSGNHLIVDGPLTGATSAKTLTKLTFDMSLPLKGLEIRPIQTQRLGPENSIAEESSDDITLINISSRDSVDNLYAFQIQTTDGVKRIFKAQSKEARDRFIDVLKEAQSLLKNENDKDIVEKNLHKRVSILLDIAKMWGQETSEMNLTLNDSAAAKRLRKFWGVGKHPEIVASYIDNDKNIELIGGSFESLVHEFIFRNTKINQHEFGAIVDSIEEVCCCSNRYQTLLFDELLRFIQLSFEKSAKVANLSVERTFVLLNRIIFYVDSTVLPRLDSLLQFIGCQENLGDKVLNALRQFQESFDNHKKIFALHEMPEDMVDYSDHFENLQSNSTPLLSLLRIPPEVMAQQLFLFHHSQYEELFNSGISKAMMDLIFNLYSDSSNFSPGYAFILPHIIPLSACERFNIDPHIGTALNPLSSHILKHILFCSQSFSPAKRAQVIVYWTRVAAIALKDFHDQFTWSSIVFAMMSSEVARLSETWRFVPSAWQQLLFNTWAPALCDNEQNGTLNNVIKQLLFEYEVDRMTEEMEDMHSKGWILGPFSKKLQSMVRIPDLFKDRLALYVKHKDQINTSARSWLKSIYHSPSNSNKDSWRTVLLSTVDADIRHVVLKDLNKQKLKLLNESFACEVRHHYAGELNHHEYSSHHVPLKGCEKAYFSIFGVPVESDQHVMELSKLSSLAKVVELLLNGELAHSQKSAFFQHYRSMYKPIELLLEFIKQQGGSRRDLEKLLEYWFDRYTEDFMENSDLQTETLKVIAALSMDLTSFVRILHRPLTILEQDGPYTHQSLAPVTHDFAQYLDDSSASKVAISLLNMANAAFSDIKRKEWIQFLDIITFSSKMFHVDTSSFPSFARSIKHASDPYALDLMKSLSFLCLPNDSPNKDLPSDSPLMDTDGAESPICSSTSIFVSSNFSPVTSLLPHSIQRLFHISENIRYWIVHLLISAGSSRKRVARIQFVLDVAKDLYRYRALRDFLIKPIVTGIIDPASRIFTNSWLALQEVKFENAELVFEGVENYSDFVEFLYKKTFSGLDTVSASLDRIILHATRTGFAPDSLLDGSWNFAKLMGCFEFTEKISDFVQNEIQSPGKTFMDFTFLTIPDCITGNTSVFTVDVKSAALIQRQEFGSARPSKSTKHSLFTKIELLEEEISHLNGESLHELENEARKKRVNDRDQQLKILLEHIKAHKKEDPDNNSHMRISKYFDPRTHIGKLKHSAKPSIASIFSHGNTTKSTPSLKPGSRGGLGFDNIPSRPSTAAVTTHVTQPSTVVLTTSVDVKTTKAVRSISLMHSRSHVASDYKKRNFVFRILTEDDQELLLQAISREDMYDWIQKLNSASAEAARKFQETGFRNSRDSLSLEVAEDDNVGKKKDKEFLQNFVTQMNEKSKQLTAGLKEMFDRNMKISEKDQTPGSSLPHIEKCRTFGVDLLEILYREIVEKEEYEKYLVATAGEKDSRNTAKSFWKRKAKQTANNEEKLPYLDSIPPADVNTVQWTAENSLPIIVKKCLDDVEARGLTEVGIYRLSGSSVTIKQFKAYFDLDPHTVDFSVDECGDVNIVTGLLKLWLRELPEPLMTFQLFDSFMQAADIQEYDDRLIAIKELVHQLPRPNYYILRGLIEHLDMVTEHEETNHMYASNLAIVFGPTLFKPPPSENAANNPDADMANTVKYLGQCSAVVKNLILQYHWIFDIIRDEPEDQAANMSQQQLIDVDQQKSQDVFVAIEGQTSEVQITSETAVIEEDDDEEDYIEEEVQQNI